MVGASESQSVDAILHVTDLSRGGAGVCRDANGQVMFVPFTVPGDQIRVRIVKKEKNYSHAEWTEIVEPSPQRVTPRCPAFGTCGGCQWQHIPYSLQWETKYKGALHALERVGVKHQTLPIEQIPAQKIWEYRNRIQLRGASGQLGFLKRKSREITPVERCDIARPEINAAWSDTRHLSEAEAQRSTHALGLLKVEVEVLPDGTIFRSWNSSHAAHGFRQVHDDQNTLMQQWIRRTISTHATAGASLYDLFGGNGNLSSGLTDIFQKIHCVDQSSPDQPGMTSHEGHQYFYHKSAVRPWVQKTATQNKKQLPRSFAILDPPREGLGKDLKDIALALQQLNVSHALIIGCDTDSWAKDLAGWIQCKWQVQQFMFIDFFPQTTHIESIALISRDAVKFA